MNFKNNTITYKNIVAFASIVFFSTQTQAKTPYLALKTSIAPVASATLQQTITGTVTDSDGVLLPGASVMVQGTSIGTTTDFDGNFSIDASAGEVLEVSYVGFETQTIMVSQQTNYNIQLAANTSELDEVLVVGYGTQKKSDLTGAVSSVVADEFNKGVVNNPGNLLQGKVSGLNVTNASGEPGAGQDIIIRGVGTLRSGTSPLYVVDGFVLDNSGNVLETNPLNIINKQDIESINLKKY